MEEDEEEAEPEKELWNAYTTVKGLTISISGLKEGKRYKFRVAAKNIMGMSLFTETRQPVEIKEQMCKSLHLICRHSGNIVQLDSEMTHILTFSSTVEPTIVMPETVSARAGAKLRVEALVSGKPAPVCKWMRGEDAVVPSSRLAVHQSGNLCVLIIKDVSRTDSGEYSLVAENSSAKVAQTLKIVIRGQYWYY